LLELGAPFSRNKTVWVLPKGRNAETELAERDPSWQGAFRLESSVTDPDARIIVASGVHRRSPAQAKGKRG
jgi:16S rRNA (guanine527-N7)-methyltransferase